MPGKGADVADTDGADNLRTAYDQLCTSYRAIDDFRAKLLGFLPLVTGGGLLAGQAADVRQEFFRPAGLFGIAVTAGLLAYELFGITKCHALLVTGEKLEGAMGLPLGEAGKPAGQFSQRPPHLLGVVNEPFAAAAIYPAVLAAWTYLVFFQDPQRRQVISLAVFAVGFLGILAYDQYLNPNSFVRRPVARLVAFVRKWRRRPQQPEPVAEADRRAAIDRTPVQ
jgi:hypothetical protein